MELELGSRQGVSHSEFWPEEHCLEFIWVLTWIRLYVWQVQEKGMASAREGYGKCKRNHRLSKIDPYASLSHADLHIIYKYIKRRHTQQPPNQRKQRSAKTALLTILPGMPLWSKGITIHPHAFGRNSRTPTAIQLDERTCSAMYFRSQVLCFSYRCEKKTLLHSIN